MTLVGLNGSDETILGPGGGEAAVVVEGPAPITLQGLTLDGGYLHRSLRFTDGDLTGDDLVFVRGSATIQGGFGGHLLADGGTMVLTDCHFDDPIVVMSHGAHVYLTNTRATFDGCSFSNGVASLDGGAVFAYTSPELTFVDTTFSNNEGSIGGAVRCLDCATTFDGVSFSDNIATSYGGSISASLGSIVVVDSSFDRERSNLQAGSIDLVAMASSLIEDTAFTDCSAQAAGGALAIFDPQGPTTVRRTRFEANDSGTSGGAIFMATTFFAAPLTIEGSLFCDNEALSGGAFAAGGLATSHVLQNNLFLRNDAPFGGAVHLTEQVVVMDHNTLVDHEYTVAAIEVATNTQLTATHNAFAGNGTALSVDGGSLFDDYNLFDGVEPVQGAVASGTTVIGDARFVDPRLGCASDLRPDTGSDLIDAGDPSLVDPDGTVPDIGAYAGPRAPELVDVDADGSLAPEDCAYADATIGPTAVEAAADGVDQDCDGFELCYVDADLDGLGSNTLDAGPVDCDTDGWSNDGSDCDDTDPLLTTDCSSIPTDPPTGTSPPTETTPPRHRGRGFPPAGSAAPRGRQHSGSQRLRSSHFGVDRAADRRIEKFGGWLEESPPVHRPVQGSPRNPESRCRPVVTSSVWSLVVWSRPSLRCRRWPPTAPGTCPTCGASRWTPSSTTGSWWPTPWGTMWPAIWWWSGGAPATTACSTIGWAPTKRPRAGWRRPTTTSCGPPSAAISCWPRCSPTRASIGRTTWPTAPTTASGPPRRASTQSPRRWATTSTRIW